MPNSPYAGSAAYIAWIYSGGTVLFEYWRNFTWNPDLNFIDATAGADTFEVLIDGHGTGQDFSVTTVGQTDGTVLLDANAKKTHGTVLYGPEGSATGKKRYSIPAIAKGPQFNQVFNNVNEITFSWRQNADHAESTF